MFVATPPDHKATEQTSSSETILAALRAVPERSGYPHWDKLRRLTPPEDLTLEEWWLGFKIARGAASRFLPMETVAGEGFWYTLPDDVLRRLHLVDQRCSGEIAMPEVVTDREQAKHHYLVNSLMEEAIRSSQLEGAATSRRVAKEMLRTGRDPSDRSERMIVNNFNALTFMRRTEGPLEPRHVIELQRILTDGTLNDPGESGRLQTPDETRVAVYDRRSRRRLHRPPPAADLPERLADLCAFANGEFDDEIDFIHPVVRAIVLHFWLAYDHPFADGNGRTARALFYWSMRESGFWLTEYLSISRIIADAPGQYARSFRLTETDAGDVTYFLIAQLKVVERAIDELHSYLERKVSEVREVERLVRDTTALNHRQFALVSDALRNEDRIYTFGGHATTHGVTHETARTDLRDLAGRGLLVAHQQGRRWRFMVPTDLAERIRS